MIPILYESTETAFTSNGLGRLRDCISCVVTEERNGIYECDFEYPIDGVNYDRIKCGRIIAVEHDESNDVQPFDIVGYSRPINGVVTFHAVHISYRQTALTVSGTNIQSLSDAFTLLGTSDPANPFAYWTDKTSSGYLGAGDGVPHSVRQVLGGMEGSILDAYGGEYEWDKWTVRLWGSRGSFRNFTIRYGVNLTNYEEELDYSNTYTSVIPYWVGQDDNGNDVIVKGDMVSASYPSFNGTGRCIPLDLSEKYETKPTKATVEAAGLAYMNANQTYLPAQSIKVDFVKLSDSAEYAQFASLQQCRLCDTINVVFPRYDMQGMFKIVKTEYNVLREKYDSLELGTLATSLAEALGISQDAPDRLSTAPSGQEVNFIYANMTSDQTLTSANTVTVLNLNNVSYSAGTKLTLNTTTHRVVIGADVNYVRVSGGIYVTTMGTTGAKNVYLYKNENIISRTLMNMTNNYNCLTAASVVVPVTQGDYITLRALSQQGTTTVVSKESYTTKLVVEVVG